MAGIGSLVKTEMVTASGEGTVARAAWTMDLPAGRGVLSGLDPGRPGATL